MYCAKCGNEIADGISFCPVCGTKILYSADTASEIDINSFDERQEQLVSASAKEGSKVIVIVVLVVVLLLLCGVLGGLCYIKYRENVEWDNWVTKYEKKVKEYNLQEKDQEEYEELVEAAKSTNKKSSREVLQDEMEAFWDETEEKYKRVHDKAKKYRKYVTLGDYKGVKYSADGSEADTKYEIWEEVLDDTEVSGIVEEEMETLRKAILENPKVVYGHYDFDVDEYFDKHQDKVDDFIEEYGFDEYMTWKMILYVIADEEAITISDEEVASAKNEFEDEMDEFTDEVIYDSFGDEYYEFFVLYEKVLDFLLENAEVEE